MLEILAAVDTSEQRAIAQADLIASLPAADSEVRVLLCHVFHDNPEGASIEQIPAIQEIKHRLDDHGIEYEFRTRSGEPTTEILDTADEEDVDMLCLSGRKRSPAGKVLFGSVTQSVILGAEQPIMMVGEQDATTSA